MRSAILSLLAMTSSIGFAAVETQEFDAKGLTHVEVHGHMGDIEISGSDRAKAYVAVDKVKFEKPCRLRMERVGDTLSVEVKKETKLNGIHCHVDLKLKVPMAASIDVENGLGNLNIVDTKGTIDIELGSGDSEIRSETSDLSVEVGMGSVKATGNFGKTKLELGMGDVEITYLTKNPQGKANIEVGNGDMTLYLPETAKISTRFQAGLGKLHQELPDAAEAQLRISASAGSGNLWIRKKTS